jgi:hypothetical protein
VAVTLCTRPFTRIFSLLAIEPPLVGVPSVERSQAGACAGEDGRRRTAVPEANSQQIFTREEFRARAEM